jgi:flagellar motor protein MotB
VTSVELIQGQFTKLQRLQEGTALTLGGETDPFAEGEWTLSKDHMKILDIVKKTLVGNRKYVEVRGHTSGYPTDSVVLEAGPEGPRVRKFDPKRDKPGDANWWMLAWLRANEVARYLLTDTGNGIKLKEDQVRIRADAWTRVLTIEHDPKIRSRNHRVEVVLTNEELRE